MSGPRDYDTKWSKSEREGQTPCYHLGVESRIWHKWVYLKNRLTDIENKLMLTKGKGRG